MPSSVATIRPLTTVPGCQPAADQTPWNTEHYTETHGIRFRNGTPEKVSGFIRKRFDDDMIAVGIPRSIFGATLSGVQYEMIGTHKRLYVVVGSQMTNITPIDTDTTVTLGTDPLAPYHHTLGSAPLATVSGSNVVTVTDTLAHRFEPGDRIQFSGASDTNGILAADLNKEHVIRTKVDSTHYTITVGALASSTGTGGGASVVRATGRVQVASVAHGLSDGDRVKISGATAFGGITTGDINKEFIIRTYGVDAFDVQTGGLSTSFAYGGGASVIYNPQIAPGYADGSLGRGYGMGRYGLGRYGVSKSSSYSRRYPRIWCFDRYADYILCSPTPGGLLYEWDGDTSEAPVRVTNSPDSLNWFFVSNNIIVTVGANGTENRIKTSDQNGRTVWTATAQNQVYDDNIEGAGRFIGQINVKGVNLIYTEKQVYTFEYIGFDTAGTTNVWKIRRIGDDCGVVGPMAAISVNGVGFWQGTANFYMWRGGNVEIVKAQTQPRATNQRYVFGRMSTNQYGKSFVWYNEPFEEINFHYPSSSGEVDSVSRFNTTDQTWCNDAIQRTCAERPAALKHFPLMGASDGKVYAHEYGADADGDSKPFLFTTNRKNAGKKEARLSAFIPDSTMKGVVTVTINGYQWPQSVTPIKTQSFTVSASSGRVELQFNCRYWSYTIEGDAIGQAFSMGTWQEELQESGDGR